MKFEVSKDIVIDAPIADVRALVEDFNHWNSWSPWTVVEPTCLVEVSGEAKELGHSMFWNGSVIGSGKNTLIRYSSERLDYALEFLKPWKSKANVSFVFEERDNKTKVTWLMDSNMPIFMFFMIKTMKNLIGMDYDRGLRMIKEIAEKGTLKSETIDNGVIEYQGFTYVGIQRTVAVADMPALMSKDFERLVDDIVSKGGRGAKHWLTIYPKFDVKNMRATYIAAVSDEDLQSLKLDPSYVQGEIASGKTLEILHNGAYDFIGNAWSMGMMKLRAKKIKGRGAPFEQYWNSPTEVQPDDLRSSVLFPIK